MASTTTVMLSQTFRVHRSLDEPSAAIAELGVSSNAGDVSTALLETKAISKSFAGVRALTGVSFDLRAGEVHALLGENGAGKSTLIKIGPGPEQPDAGSLLVGGHAVRHMTPAVSRSLGIAAIYQQPALFPDLTVAENIALALET